MLDDHTTDGFEMLPRRYQRCEAEPDSIVPVLDCQEKTAEERVGNLFSEDGRLPQI